MDAKVLLVTVFSGYNYGSSLQAFAGKMILKELGYDCLLIAQRSLIKGRDIRVNKLLTILVRSYMHRKKNGFKSLKTYRSSYKKTMIEDSILCFEEFTKKYLHPEYLSWKEMKEVAKNVIACFAGSDQIWNSSTMYVDPMYYLRFVSSEKRIALAPSFGRNFIADYNMEKIGKWISEFAYISVREDSGVKLIKEMTGRDATHLVDPTLMLSGDTWRKEIGIQNKEKNYILAYFLDKPSESARKSIAELKEALKCKVIAIPYLFDDMSYCDNVVSAGPIEFLNLINNAKCVLTDSFHGTAFSINMHTPFFVFNRVYGTANSQNNRVESILKKVNMQERFEPKEVLVQYAEIDFDYSEKVLAKEREKAHKYLSTALNEIERNEE